MKNLKIRKRISDYLSRNKWQILIVFASLFAGIIIASFFSARMSAEKSDAVEKYVQNFVSAYGLQSVDNREIFRLSLYNNIKTALFLWLSGLWVYLLPIGLLQIGLKGYKAGFSTVVFVRLFGIGGIVFSLISMLSQLVLLLPALILYCVFNINFAFTLQSIRYKFKSAGIKNKLYIKNLLFFVAIITISILAGLIDAYIIPPILKPICLLLNR